MAIAARRGKKGFSSILNEAVESYLSEEAAREKRRQRALQLRGVLRRQEAAELQKNAAVLRASWR
jgi:hypothetical protein